MSRIKQFINDYYPIMITIMLLLIIAITLPIPTSTYCYVNYTHTIINQNHSTTITTIHSLVERDMSFIGLKTPC